MIVSLASIKNIAFKVLFANKEISSVSAENVSFVTGTL